MEDSDLKAIGRWIAKLHGPGVLVVGQPLLAKKSHLCNLTERFELGLPDYESQYDELLGYIKHSKHSIVVFTGDVHFGRIATCKLDAEKGTKFVEIISSPMMVVTNAFGKAELSTLQSARDINPSPISTIQEEIFTGKQNHFLTIEFSRDNDEPSSFDVAIKVKFWPILNNPEAETCSVSRTVYEALLR